MDKLLDRYNNVDLSYVYLAGSRLECWITARLKESV